MNLKINLKEESGRSYITAFTAVTCAFYNVVQDRFLGYPT